MPNFQEIFSAVRSDFYREKTYTLHALSTSKLLKEYEGFHKLSKNPEKKHNFYLLLSFL